MDVCPKRVRSELGELFKECARFGLGVTLKQLDVISMLTIHPFLEATCGTSIDQRGRSTAEVES